MKKSKKHTNRITLTDFIKAIKKGSREGEIELGNRLKSIIYKNKKKYNRKNKHNNNNNYE